MALKVLKDRILQEGRLMEGGIGGRHPKGRPLCESSDGSLSDETGCNRVYPSVC